MDIWDDFLSADADWTGLENNTFNPDGSTFNTTDFSAFDNVAENVDLSGGDSGGGEQPFSFGSPDNYTAPDRTSPAYTAPANDGMFAGVTEWARKNDKLAATLAGAIMSAIGGGAKASLDRETMEKKIKMEREYADLMAKDKTARTAANAFKGNVGVSPGGGILTSANGMPVYNPAKRGIIGA